MHRAKPVPSPARDRLLDAAARVFARDGLTGATTRAIAREASVNEVTLFRHFRSKERLIAAVVRRNFGDHPAGSALAPRVAATADLRADLVSLADEYVEKLRENLPLVRAMLGEIHRHGSNERQVYRGLFQPLREAMVERFETAKKLGELQPAADSVMMSDLFTGMLFTDVLRRASPTFQRHFSSAAYRAMAVDLVVKGAAR